MILKEKSEIWGISIKDACDYGSLRRLVNLLILGTSGLVIGTAVSVMESSRVVFSTYFQVMFVLFVFAFFLKRLFLRERLYRVYRFYKWYGKCEVKTMDVKITADEFYVLLCKLYKTKTRLTGNESLSSYADIAVELCTLHDDYSRRLWRSLHKRKTFESNETVSELLRIEYVEKGHKGCVVSLSVVSADSVGDESLEKSEEIEDTGSKSDVAEEADSKYGSAVDSVPLDE